MTRELTEENRNVLGLDLSALKAGQGTIAYPFSPIDPAVMRSLRSDCCNACLLAATRSPETFSPEAVFPENVKTGMVASPHLAAGSVPDFLVTVFQCPSL